MTTRANLPAAILGRQTVHGVLVAELDHPDGVIRVHSGTHNIWIGGTEYAGAGGLLQVSGITDDRLSEGPHSWTMSLSRVTPALAPLAADDRIRDRAVRLAVSVSEDGIAWQDPVTLKVGRVSTVVIRAEGIAVECATAALDLSRIRQRHTQWTESQQRNHVNVTDATFQRVEEIKEVVFSWP